MAMGYEWTRTTVTATMQELIVRKADLSDYGGIISMDPNNAVYNGDDYLPAHLHEILQKPHAYSFVAQIKGVTVAYCVVYVEEELGLLVTSGARMRSDLQGQGVFQQFRATVLGLMKGRFPGCRTLRWTGVLTPHLEKLYERPDSLIQIIDKWNFLQFEVECHRVPNICQNIANKIRPRHVRVTNLDLKDVSAITSSVTTCRALFPGGYIYTGYEWLPLPVPTDRPKMLHQQEAMVCVVRESDRADPVGFGVVNLHMGQLGPSNLVGMYGSSDGVHALSLIAGALPKISRHETRKTFLLSLSFPLETRSETITDTVQAVPGMTLVSARLGYQVEDIGFRSPNPTYSHAP